MSIYARQDEEIGASNERLRMIDSLLHTSTLEDIQRRNIEHEMWNMDEQRAEDVIEMLRLNQLIEDRDMLKKIQSRK